MNYTEFKKIALNQQPQVGSMQSLVGTKAPGNTKVPGSPNKPVGPVVKAPATQQPAMQQPAWQTSQNNALSLYNIGKRQDPLVDSAIGPRTDFKQLYTDKAINDISTLGTLPNRADLPYLTRDQQNQIAEAVKTNKPVIRSNSASQRYVLDIRNNGTLPSLEAMKQLTPQHRELVQKALVEGGYALPADTFSVGAKPADKEWSTYLDELKSGIKGKAVDTAGGVLNYKAVLMGTRGTWENYKKENPHLWPSLVNSLKNADPEALKAIQEMASGKGGDLAKILSPEEMNELTSAAKSATWNSIKKDWFTNLPKVAGLFLRQYLPGSMNGIANYAENPLIFYGGALTALLGGSLLLGGGDDDDEDEDERPRYAANYDPRMARVPYA